MDRNEEILKFAAIGMIKSINDCIEEANRLINDIRALGFQHLLVEIKNLDLLRNDDSFESARQKHLPLEEPKGKQSRRSGLAKEVMTFAKEMMNEKMRPISATEISEEFKYKLGYELKRNAVASILGSKEKIFKPYSRSMGPPQLKWWWGLTEWFGVTGIQYPYSDRLFEHIAMKENELNNNI